MVKGGTFPFPVVYKILTRIDWGLMNYSLNDIFLAQKETCGPIGVINPSVTPLCGWLLHPAPSVTLALPPFLPPQQLLTILAWCPGWNLLWPLSQLDDLESWHTQTQCRWAECVWFCLRSLPKWMFCAAFELAPLSIYGASQQRFQ